MQGDACFSCQRQAPENPIHMLKAVYSQVGSQMPTSHSLQKDHLYNSHESQPQLSWMSLQWFSNPRAPKPKTQNYSAHSAALNAVLSTPFQHCCFPQTGFFQEFARLGWIGLDNVVQEECAWVLGMVCACTMPYEFTQCLMNLPFASDLNQISAACLSVLWMTIWRAFVNRNMQPICAVFISGLTLSNKVDRVRPGRLRPQRRCSLFESLSSFMSLPSVSWFPCPEVCFYQSVEQLVSLFVHTIAYSVGIVIWLSCSSSMGEAELVLDANTWTATSSVSVRAALLQFGFVCHRADLICLYNNLKIYIFLL